MITVTSQHLQSKFAEISDIVKSHEPVIVTQHQRPTMMVWAYDDAIETMRLAAKMRFLQRLDEHAKLVAEPTDDELAELNRLIEEEREIVYQEKLRNNEY